MKPLQSVVFSLSVFISGCMCTAPPDTVTIKGITAATSVNSSISNQCIISISSTHSIETGDKKHCLTYNKLEAADIVRNGITEGSFTLVCDKNIDTVQAGNPINIIQPEILNGKVINSKILLNISKIPPGSLCHFTLSCRTLENQILSSVFPLQL